MNSSVIVFPGSNCDRDIAVALEKMQFKNQMVWHKETTLPKSDLIVLPGGFSYGDYLRSGAIAGKSLIIDEVIKAANKGCLILGICNGFQILTETGLLKGTLLRNKNLKFINKDVRVKVTNNETKFSNKYKKDEVLNINIASIPETYQHVTDTIAVDKGEELLRRPHCGDKGLWSARPSDLPTGERKDLAGGRDRQGALGHAGQRGERDVFAIKDEMLVDLIDYSHDIVLDTEAGNEGEFVTSKDLAGRVVRRIEEQNFGLCSERGCEFIRIKAEVGGSQGDYSTLRAAHGDTCRIGVVVGLKGHDLVAGPSQREHGGGERLGGTCGDEHLAVGIEPLTAESGSVLADSEPEGWDARHRRVLVVAVSDRLDRGLADLDRAIGVGKPLAEVHGAGLHCKRRHLSENRGAESLKAVGEEWLLRHRARA